MSTKPMKPLPGQQPPQAQVKVDLKDAESVTCEKCGTVNSRRLEGLENFF